MSTTILQVPLKKELRDHASMAAEKQGFSSLQEAVRIFLSQLAEEEVRVGFNPPTVRLSDKNDKRYAKIIEDIRTGKAKTRTFHDADSFIKHLDSLS